MTAENKTAKKRKIDRRKTDRRWFWEIFSSKIVRDRRGNERRAKKDRRTK